MVDQKHKTPEELGEAVGKKIEELFGGMFADEESLASQPMTQAQEATPPAPLPKPQPGKAPPEAGARVAPAPPQAASTQTKPQAVPSPAGQRKPEAPPKSGPSQTPEVQWQDTGAHVFDQIMERIEILILNLEWEVSPDSVAEIVEKLGQLGPLIPAEGPAHTIVSMNLRVLQRFKTPDAVPHRSLLKLLQDSVSALKLINSSQGRQAPGQALISAITNGYKEIIAATVPTEASAAATAPVSKDAQTPFARLVNNVGNVTRSLEEVSQRLARILGVLRQGGTMSADEITRRLGTLEQLLSERVGQLVSFHKEMADVQMPAAEGLVEVSTPAEDDNALLLMLWAGMYLAVQFKMVTAVYRLSKTQGREFMNAPAIRMGEDMIMRLPLKRPSGAVTAVPEWFVHLSPRGRREYFIMPEKLLGYCLAPKGVNATTQARIKIGAISYATINQSVLR